MTDAIDASDGRGGVAASADYEQTQLVPCADEGEQVVATDFSTSSDDELMLRYGSGDIDAFNVLYQRHRGALYRFFTRQLPQSQAEDAFQETWSKLITSSAQYQAQGQFTGFLFRLAHNVLVDTHRKNMRSVLHEPAEDDPDDFSNPTDNLDKRAMQSELQQRLFVLLKKLPLNQRTVWLLKQETTMSMSDIAAVTETSLEGVKSRLRYANEKLKAGLLRYV